MTTALIAVLLLATVVAGFAATAVLQDSAQHTARLRAAAGQPRVSPVARWVSALDARLRRTRPGHRLEAALAGAALAWTPTGFVGRVGGLALGVGVVASPLLGRIGSAVIAVAVVAGAVRWLEQRRARRVEEFIGQLPELARVLANAASAGLALRTALQMAGREMEAPAGEELTTVAAQMSVGRSLDAALHDLSERLPSRELGVLVQTLVIQSRSGGALVTALANIAATLDQRRELRREIRTAVSGAVFGGYVVLALAVGAVVVMNVFSPGALDQLVGTLAGQFAVGAAAVMFTAGFVLIRRITRIEV